MYKNRGFRETGRGVTDKASGLRAIELECDLSITVREAEKKDFGRVLTLFKQLWPGKVLNRKLQEAIYQEMRKSDGYKLLCAERSGTIQFVNYLATHLLSCYEWKLCLFQ